jgi:hypothetical protein
MARISHNGQIPFFWGVVDEGPRSRRYGRTAALRLIVQPCDKDDYFFIFALLPSTYNSVALLAVYKLTIRQHINER